MASLTVQTIFGVFQRLHHAGTYAGSGIGLAIVQKSVERMGGKVGVLPLPENGSSNVPFVLQTVQSGDSAIAYLEGAPPFSDRAKSPLPDAILLDLKMPGRSGFDVLKWIKSQPHFAGLPILVFTSSIHEEDRARALAMDAS